ncbi:MAG: hypothetical protein LBK22_08555 [Tannerella sp.]|jgi:hypothetical protein|nr:hypothetical protein [Tannerella sp.]
MKHISIPAGILFLYLFLSGAHAESVERVAPVHPVAIQKISMEENPDGLGFGFWCNNAFNRNVFHDFGRRPYERHGFFSWSSVEAQEGIYQTDHIVQGIQRSHALGSNCIVAFNSISGPWFNEKIRSKIPAFYPRDILDETTRKAAGDCIYAVVKSILPQVGDLWLTFDYEMMWHCSPDTEAKQQMYRDWFLEAAAIARRAAGELKMEASLKIMPVVNGSTEDPAVKRFLNSPAQNHRPAQWLTDVVSVCDFLAIDSYDFDLNDPVNPQKTLQALAFWIRHYSAGKPVHVTEFGYSSGNTPYPSHRTAYHACGTEEQQAEFYRRLFPLLTESNRPGKLLTGQLRSFQFWMYADQKTQKAAFQREDHFGIIRLDKSRKPAFDAIASGIASVEGSPDTSPSLRSAVRQVSPAELKGGLETVYRSGTSFDCLQCVFDCSAVHSNRLHVETEKPGNLLVEAGGKWYRSDKSRKHVLALDNNRDNSTVNLYLTGGIFPAVQQVKQIYFK